MKKAALYSFFFCLILGIKLTSANSWFPPTGAKTCTFTREDALQCALRHGDTDKDGRLDQAEMEQALNTLVPRYIRWAAWFRGVDISRVLQDCDYDHDGVLTPRDWAMSEKTCMPKQENLCEFKWFCDRADKN